MKKVFLTMLVVLVLLFTAIGVSMAAPDDIPDALGTCNILPRQVECVQISTIGTIDRL